MNPGQFFWQRSVYKFLTAQTISLFGSSLVQYAIIWHITLNTQLGSMLGIATLCAFLPQVLIALFAGVWIDHCDRKKLIVISDAIIALITLLLALSFLAGQRSIWLLFIALSVRSAGTGVQTPAVNALIPQLAPKEALIKVNGLNSTLSAATIFLSPAVSGSFLAVSSLEFILFIDVLTAIIGIALTLSINIPPYSKDSLFKQSDLAEIKKGFSYLKQHNFMVRMLLFQIIILFLISPSAFLTPLLISRTFGPEVWRLALTEMSYSLGMILGGLLITAWGGFKKHIYTSLLAAGFYGLLMLGLGNVFSFPLYLTLNTLIGIASPCYNTPITVLIQKHVSPGMQGRIFSLMQISTACALPLGMVFFGPLADRVQIQCLFIVPGIIVLLLTVFVWHFKQIKTD